MSRTFPSRLTGRHRYFRFPLIVRTPRPDAICHQAGPALLAPLPDRLLADDDLRASIISFDLTETERKPLVQPHTVADDLPRVSMALVQRRRRGTRRRSLPRRPTESPIPPHLNNLQCLIRPGGRAGVSLEKPGMTDPPSVRSMRMG